MLLARYAILIPVPLAAEHDGNPAYTGRAVFAADGARDQRVGCGKSGSQCGGWGGGVGETCHKEVAELYE